MASKRTREKAALQKLLDENPGMRLKTVKTQFASDDILKRLALLERVLEAADEWMNLTPIPVNDTPIRVKLREAISAARKKDE